MPPVEQALKAAEEAARSLFFEDPSLSIHEAARELKNKLRVTDERALRLPVLANIRREVREKIGVGLQEEEETMATPAQRHKTRTPFNPPRIRDTRPPPAPDEPKEPRVVITSTKDDRVRFLNEWAEQHPYGSIAQARKALIDKFGVSLGNDLMSEILRDWKALHDEAQKKAGREPAFTPEEPTKDIEPTPMPATPTPEDGQLRTRSAIEIFVRTMRLNGIKSIVVHDDGTYDLQMSGRA